ncbi:MAG TPA: putative Ig domain-containing protein [Streptosporangiaceae bacterium]|jgi:DNA-binding beta-propeller fold protein YncE
MKRAVVAVCAAASALLASLPVTVALAAPPGGYAVSRVVLPSRAFGIAADPVTGLVYVGTSSGGGRIMVIDGATQALEGSITVPGTPYDVAVNPVTDTIYASGAGGITVIDGATRQVVTTIASASRNVAVDPATDTVYADAIPEGSGTRIAVIDGATNSITSTIELATTAGTAFLAADASTDTIFAAANASTGTLYAIDGATDTVTRSLQLPGSWITSIAFDPANDSIYAVDNGANTVHVVSATTLTVTTSITGCAHWVAAAAADPTANVVFVTSAAGVNSGAADSTCVIDGATNAVADTFPRGGTAVATDPATGAAYISGWNPSTDIWTATPGAANQLSPMVYGFGPYIFGSPSATFAVGVSSSFSLLASALPAATLNETGALPAGITMSSSGVFSGTPAAGTVGTYPITVTASNGVSPACTISVAVVVDIAPSITSAASATFQTGVHGSFTVQAAGSPAPAVSAGGYPSWMTFTQGNSSGVLSGTPPPGSGGLWPVNVWAQNSFGFTPTQTLMLTVNEPPTLAVASRLTFRAGHSVRYQITSTGFPAPVLRESGRLPRGLKFRAGRNGTALIVGTPARGEKGKRFIVTITASNHIGRAATKSVTIRIR